MARSKKESDQEGGAYETRLPFFKNLKRVETRFVELKTTPYIDPEEGADGPSSAALAGEFKLAIELGRNEFFRPGDRVMSAWIEELFPGVGAMREESAKTGQEYILQSKKVPFPQIRVAIRQSSLDERPSIVLPEAEITGGVKLIVMDGHGIVEVRIKAVLDDGITWDRIRTHSGTTVYVSIQDSAADPDLDGEA